MSGIPSADLYRLLLQRIIPIGLVLGASMEGFMYFTGFWDVALRKETERREERRQTLETLRSHGAPVVIGGKTGSSLPPEGDKLK